MLQRFAFLIPLIFFSCVHDASLQSSKTQDKISFPVATKLTGIKTRALVLPVYDETGLIIKDVLSDIEINWTRLLSENSDFLPLTSKDLKLDPKNYQKGTGLDDKELANLLFKSNIAFFIEPRILSIKARGKVDPVGVIRRAQTEVIMRLQLKVFYTRHRSEFFYQVKTLTLEESQLRLGTKDTETKAFVIQNPDVIEKRLLEGFSDFIPEMQIRLSEIRWEGRIAMVQGDRIYLNVGKLSGLKVGDLLKVLDVGDEVFDPQSGRFIGRTPGRLKGTVEVLSFFGEDGSIATLTSGSGFRENDRVELHW